MGLLDDIKKIPDAKGRTRVFNKEEDYAIWKYWKIKPQKDLSLLLHTTHTTVRNRYNELTEQPEYIQKLRQEFENV